MSAAREAGSADAFEAADRVETFSVRIARMTAHCTLVHVYTRTRRQTDRYRHTDT